jgi:hypothetical protein
VGEINKTTTIQVTATKTLNIKWILADTVPATAPTGYVRLSDLDIPLGSLGTLWAYSN